MKKYYKYLVALLGSAILAFGMYNIHAQSDITEGGILGLGLLIKHCFGVSPALSTAVMSALCYIIGISVLGREFVLMSAVSGAGYSAAYLICECFPPLFPQIARYPLAAAVLGALFVGVGCGLCVRAGGAPSGDDALAMALSSLLKIGIQWVYLAGDVVVLALSLSYIPLSRIVWSLLTVIISGQLVGLIANKRQRG